MNPNITRAWAFLGQLICFAVILYFAFTHSARAEDAPKVPPADPVALQAKVDELSKQVTNLTNVITMVQQQRNQLSGQMLDGLANLQLLQTQIEEKDKRIAGLEATIADKPKGPAALPTPTK